MLAHVASLYSTTDWVLMFVVGGGGVATMGTLLNVGKTMGRIGSTLEAIEGRIQRLESINDRKVGR